MVWVRTWVDSNLTFFLLKRVKQCPNLQLSLRRVARVAGHEFQALFEHLTQAGYVSSVLVAYLAQAGFIV